MTPFVVALGISGAIVIVAGLAGGRCTLRGSFGPRVGQLEAGRWVSLPCLGVGVILVLASIGLGLGLGPAAQPSTPAAAIAPGYGEPPGAASPETASPGTGPAAAPAATGVIVAPPGFSTIYVYSQPSTDAPMVTLVADGARVGIRCAEHGDVVMNPDSGQTSSVWDGMSGGGFVPGVFVSTRAAIGSC